MAAEQGNLDEVKFLVKEGADVNIQDDDGVSIYKTILPRVD